MEVGVKNTKHMWAVLGFIVGLVFYFNADLFIDIRSDESGPLMLNIDWYYLILILLVFTVGFYLIGSSKVKNVKKTKKSKK